MYLCVMFKKLRLSVLCAFGLLLLASCGNDTEQQPEDAAMQRIDTTTYSGRDFHLPALSAQADTIAKDWPVFKDFKYLSNHLNNISLEEMKRKSWNLTLITDSLSKSLPEAFNSPAIQSRLVVVKTRVKLLNQEANLAKPHPKKITRYIDETYAAIDHFILHINEKMEKDRIDATRQESEKAELRKQLRARDSIYQLELEDQN